MRWQLNQLLDGDAILGYGDMQKEVILLNETLADLMRIPSLIIHFMATRLKAIECKLICPCIIQCVMIVSTKG